MIIGSIHIDKIRQVYPKWNIDKLQYTKLTGFTNKTYKVANKNLGKNILLRIYTHLTPNINMHVLTTCSEAGFGPKILLSYPEGRLESWIYGRVLVHEDLNATILNKIAKKLKSFHNIVGYNHNDLNLKNIMILDSGEIQFIDFEYCSKLDPLFDIANFFTEWMYVYENIDWYKPDITLLPTKKQIKMFYNEYASNADNIDNIIDKLPTVHKYWLNWASNINTQEYNLFKIYRERIKYSDHTTFFKD